MENGKIILEHTNDGTTIAVNATAETMFFLLANLISDMCEKTETPMPAFLMELVASCKAFEIAKKEARNNE